MGLERSVLAIRFRSFVEFRISSRELMLLVAEFSAVDCLIIGQLNNKWSKDNGEEHWHVIFWMNFVFSEFSLILDISEVRGKDLSLFAVFQSRVGFIEDLLITQILE